MKGTFIKSTKQLPEWFKLENYRKAEFFNAPEWFDELMPRYAMRRGIKKFIEDPIDLSTRWNLIKQDGLLFYSTQRDNISHTARTLAADLLGHRKSLDLKNKLEHEFPSLMSLPNMVAMAFESCFINSSTSPF